MMFHCKHKNKELTISSNDFVEAIVTAYDKIKEKENQKKLESIKKDKLADAALFFIKLICVCLITISVILIFVGIYYIIKLAEVSALSFTLLVLIVLLIIGIAFFFAIAYLSFLVYKAAKQEKDRTFLVSFAGTFTSFFALICAIVAVCLAA